MKRNQPLGPVRQIQRFGSDEEVDEGQQIVPGGELAQSAATPHGTRLALLGERQSVELGHEPEDVLGDRVAGRGPADQLRAIRPRHLGGR